MEAGSTPAAAGLFQGFDPKGWENVDAGSVASTLRLPGKYAQALEHAQALSIGYSRGDVTSTDLLKEAGLSDFFSPMSPGVSPSDEPAVSMRAWQDTDVGDWALNTHP